MAKSQPYEKIRHSDSDDDEEMGLTKKKKVLEVTVSLCEYKNSPKTVYTTNLIHSMLHRLLAEPRE